MCIIRWLAPWTIYGVSVIVGDELIRVIGWSPTIRACMGMEIEIFPRVDTSYYKQGETEMANTYPGQRLQQLATSPYPHGRAVAERAGVLLRRSPIDPVTGRRTLTPDRALEIVLVWETVKPTQYSMGQLLALPDPQV